MAFERAKAKLIGYFGQPQLTLRQYPESDTSIPARMHGRLHIRARPMCRKRWRTLDSLLADVPDDPYFLELKAQVLFESGDIDGAIAPFRRAVEQKPDEPLLRAEFARVLIENCDHGKPQRSGKTPQICAVAQSADAGRVAQPRHR